MTKTATCPDGHVSATSDYCDRCGARIDGSSEQAAPQPSQQLRTSSFEAGEVGPVPKTCPGCGAGRGAADRFCEVCGYDFLHGTSGAPAPPTPDVTVASGWEAVVTADRAYFERLAPEGVEFPEEPWERVVTLTEDELHIGRAQPAAGARPGAALTGAAADPAISRLHAILVRQADGSYAIVDQGSTNGTSINDDVRAIAANVPVALADGDRIHLGAWTTITLQRRPSGAGET